MPRSELRIHLDDMNRDELLRRFKGIEFSRIEPTIA